MKTENKSHGDARATAPAGTSHTSAAAAAHADRPGHFRVGDRWVGANEPCYIIAEIGPNHNGDLATAKRLVDVAAEAGADAAKFQKRKLSEVYQDALLADPKQGEQGLQYLVPLLIEFELSDDEFRELSRYCGEKGITFLCTPWDRNSVDFLETLNVPAYKIGSPDMTNLPLIDYTIATGKPVFVSTGMATEAEIRCTLAFLKERRANAGLFHCVSTYPVSADEINLRFMNTLRDWSGYPVGYSGHDTGIATSLAAVGMGASILEKHITLDRTMRGPDHKASLEPQEFIALVRAVREVEAALGGTQRWITRGEILNRRSLAKSLVAARDVPRGAVITREDLTSKSPGMGLSPQRMGELIGRKAPRDFKRDEMFMDADLADPEAPQAARPIDIGMRWGIIARFMDVDPLVEEFGDKGMELIEFHVSDRDLDQGMAGFRKKTYDYDLVIHAPEYCHDELIDLCSSREEQRAMSVARIQKTVDLARELTPYFTKVGPRGPKIVMHVGGMSPTPGRYDLDRAIETLLRSLSELDTNRVDLLLENLPPYPWYFGGRWFGHVLTDGPTTARLCEASGLGLCFDTSHASLECHRTGESLADFARTVQPYVRHLHLSDGAGVSGEGLQIHDGHVNFVELLPIVAATGATCVPEIWMGHHDRGAGFRLALDRLTEATWAARALANAGGTIAERLRHLVVPTTATLAASLSAIESNHLGIVFIVDDTGAVLGVATDGNIRRGLLAGRTLESPVIDIINREYVYAFDKATPAEVRALLSARIRVIPILDANRRLIDVASVYEADNAAALADHSGDIQ
jgi:N-acetylneuraminate synthase